MRLSTFALVSISLVSPSIFASPCTTPKDPEDKIKLAKYLQKETTNHYDDLIFVFMDKDGNYDSDDTIHLKLERDQSTAKIDSKILELASKKGVSVHVFHRNSVFAYIIPIEKNKMPSEFEPEKHCPEATTSNRTISGPPENDVGCDVVNLEKLTAATVLYDQSAKSCSTFTEISKKLSGKLDKLKKKSKDEAKLEEAITSFNNTFGTNNKLGDFTGIRKPAFSKITVSNDKNQEIGQPKTGGDSKPGTKKKHAGNAD